MNYDFKFSAEALEDLKQISGYITSEFQAPQSAAKIVRQIVIRARQLAVMPERGRLYSIKSGIQLRSIQTRKYTIVYTVDKTNRLVEVLLIAHSRRNLTALLKSRQQSQD